MVTPLRIKEEDIQITIVDYLRYSGWKVLVYAPPRAHGKLGGILEPGHPDLLAIRAARGWIGVKYLWVEVKRPGEKLSPDQERLHAELREVKAWVVVWCSVEEAIAALASLGLGLPEWRP